MTELRKRASGMFATAVLVLGTACERTQPTPAATEKPAAATEVEVAVKGAVDPQEATAEVPSEKSSAETEEARQRYSPYARKYPTRAYFGDTHHHSANSGDAFMAGDRLTQEQSYRFARGEASTSPRAACPRSSRARSTSWWFPTTRRASA